MRGFHYLFAVLLALAFAVSCGGDEPVEPDPPTPVTPDDPTPPKDTNAPTITVSSNTVNVIAGPAVTISGDELKIGDKSVATWKDDVSSSCTVALTFTPTEGAAKTLNSGDTVSEAGKLQIKATDESDNSSTADVDLTAVAVYGLENLQGRQLQVDQEVNLLEGLTIAEGLSLQKVEIEADGVRKEVSPPETYTPEYPGSVNLILTIMKPDGSTLVERADGIIVNPLDYQAPQLEEVNIFESSFPWYKNLNKTAKNYVKPLLEVAFYASNRCRDPNTINIILGEHANGTVNIGSISDLTNEHADQGLFHISLWCPDIEIISCLESIDNGGDMICLEKYINQHPNQSFIISCASDSAVGNDRDEWYNSDTVRDLERILNNPRVMMIGACKNKSKGRNQWIIYNETIKTGNLYKSVSLNGNQDNNFMAIGEFPGSTINFFCQQFNEGLKCCKPEGFDGEGCTTPLFMYGVVNRDYTQYTQTDGSMSTASAAGILRPISEIIRSNNPSITQAESARIIKKNYLDRERLKYKDPDTGQMLEGEYCYRINGETVKNHEVLPLNELETIQLTSASGEILLPGRKGLYYEGMGIYFKYEGKTYESVKSNQDVLEQALKSGSVEWYFNGNQFRKEGGKGSVTLNVYSTDTDAKVFLHTTITKSVLSE